MSSQPAPEVSVSADAVEVAARAMHDREPTPDYDEPPCSSTAVGPLGVCWCCEPLAQSSIAAALPVLRAEWEKPLRELAAAWDDHAALFVAPSDLPTRQDWEHRARSLRAALDALPGGEQAPPSPVQPWLSDDCDGGMCRNCVSERIGCSCQCHDATPSGGEQTAVTHSLFADTCGAPPPPRKPGEDHCTVCLLDYGHDVRHDWESGS